MADKKFNILELKEESKTWRTVLIDKMSAEEKDLFLKRKMAVDMYLEGQALKNITKVTGIHRTEPSRFILRCRKLDEFGIPFGYPALIPYKRQNEYIRRESLSDTGNKGLSGAFRTLINLYPGLNDFIINTYFGKSKMPKEKNITPKLTHTKFLAECRNLGITESDYPFTTNDLGQRAMYRYLKELEDEYSNNAIYRYGDNAVQKHNSVGSGNINSMPVTRPFSVVQMDGHKIDCIMTVKIMTPEGDIQSLPISRIWLLTAIDVATRTILGHHITINTEYNRFDVLKCIKNTIEPKVRMIFTIEGLRYPESGGYHSEYIPEAGWALFDEIMLDNALAHLSKDVMGQLTEYLKCTVNFGPVATPERRGIIERFFETIETRGFHRLVSTTGTGINDPRRKNAESDAIKFEIKYEDIIEITEVLIAQYNNTPHESLNGFTPLEIMKQRMDRGLTPRFLPYDYRNNFEILSFTDIRTVTGSMETGRRPYISYMNVEYRSEVLSKSYSLIGEKLIIKINPKDLRFLQAYFDDGTEFDLLIASGKWSKTKHSLKDRQRINAFINYNKIKLTQFDDPIDMYHKKLIKDSLTQKKERNTLLDLEKSTDKKQDFTPKENPPVPIKKAEDKGNCIQDECNSKTEMNTNPLHVNPAIANKALLSNDDLRELFKNKNKKAKLL
jgi:transposase InsO family protein